MHACRAFRAFFRCIMFISCSVPRLPRDGRILAFTHKDEKRICPEHGLHVMEPPSVHTSGPDGPDSAPRTYHEVNFVSRSCHRLNVLSGILAYVKSLSRTASGHRWGLCRSVVSLPVLNSPNIVTGHALFCKHIQE